MALTTDLQIPVAAAGVPLCTAGGQIMTLEELLDLPGDSSQALRGDGSWGSLLTYSLIPWTPGVASTGGTNPTFTTLSGTATQIGRIVTITGYLVNAAGGTPGNGAQQLSLLLPSTASASQLAVRIPVGSGLNNATTYSLFGTFTAGSDRMDIWKFVSGGAPDIAAFTNNDLNHANIRQILVQGSYIV